MLPTLEDQRTLVQTADQELREVVKTECPGPDHKAFRMMVKQLLPILRDTPASGKTDYHGAYTGGLLVHTTEVIKTALRVAESSGGVRISDAMLNDVDVPRGSIVKAAFFHDLGKIGDGQDPYYLPQDNEWRRENLGEIFTINWEMNNRQYLPVPVRSLWFAQHHGVPLTQAEYQAIFASDGPDTPMGRAVSAIRETPLSMIVHFADKWVSIARGV